MEPGKIISMVDAKKIKQRLETMRTHRANFENTWEEILRLVRPSTSSFQGSNTPGDQKTQDIYDSTAPWACEQLAGGLNSFLTSPVARWFNLVIANQPDQFALPQQVLAWLEQVADILYGEYGRPVVNFNSTIHEAYLDIGAFGTAVLYQEYSSVKNHVCFYSFPLASCYISESASGLIDCVFRKFTMTTRQLMEKFPETIPKKVREEKEMEKKHEMVHAVFPRTERNIGRLDKFNKPWASAYVLVEGDHVLAEGGYDSMPYHVCRWTKISGEIYGRSPAWTALPDIRVVNAMSKVVLKAAQKIVDPPLMVPDDGFIMPLKTSPGSLLFYTPGTDPILPLETKGQVQIGLDQMDQRRGQITRTFYVDYILREKKRERQTQLEISDDRQEMLRQMSPMLGRIQTELLSPMLVRTFNLLMMVGRIPPAPIAMAEGQYSLAIEYVSPAAIAQIGTKADSMSRFIQEIVPLASVSPGVLDVVDFDKAVQDVARYRDVPRSIIRDPKLIAQIRQERSQKEQEAQAAGQAQQSASTLKDVAMAQKAMGGG